MQPSIPRLAIESQAAPHPHNLPQVVYGRRKFTCSQDIAPLRSKEVLIVLRDALNYLSLEFERFAKGPLHTIQELSNLALKVAEIKATAASRREYIPYLRKPQKIARAFTCIQALDELLPRIEKKLRYTQVLALSPEYQVAILFYQQFKKSCGLITQLEEGRAIEELLRHFNELENFINPDATPSVKEAEYSLYEKLLELLHSTGQELEARITNPKLSFIMKRIRDAKVPESPESPPGSPIHKEYKSAISKIHVYLDPPEKSTNQEAVIRLYEVIKVAYDFPQTNALEWVRVHALIDTIISRVGRETLKFTEEEEHLERGLIDGTITMVPDALIQGYLKKGFLWHIAFSLKEKNPTFEQAYNKAKHLLPQQLAPKDFCDLQDLYLTL